MTVQVATFSTDCTLNRAHKIVERLKTLLTADAENLEDHHVTRLTGGESAKRNLERNKAKSADGVQNAKEQLHMLELLGNARHAIASANMTFGVTRLLAEETVVKGQIALLERHVSAMKNESAIDEAEFFLLEEEASNKATAAREIAVQSKTSYHEPSPATRIVRNCSDAVVNELKEALESLKARKVAIADGISDANANKVTLVLPEKFRKTLTGE